jgi:small subunit ribosomal protein S14
MNYGKQIDQLRRNLLKNTEEKRSLLKAISKDSHLPWRDRQEAIIRLARLPRNGSKTRIRNRCILTGRTRSIQQPFKLSRISFRQLAARGLLPGVYKASW